MEKLNINNLRKLPFSVNYGMADLSIRRILDDKYDTEIDWDVYLPTKGMNLQRPFVWTLEQKQELILSVFKGIQLPPISILSLRDREKKINRYQIIDGKQRLSTLISFVKNEFSVNYEGREYFFNDLCEYSQNDFLSTGMVRSNIGYDYLDTPISDDAKIKWFEMINYTGTPQEKEHLENLKK